MSTTVKGEDVDDDLDVEDDDVNQYGEAQYSERDIVVNPDDENEDSAALREMVSGTPISRSSSSGPSGQGQSVQRPGYEATVSDDGWKQHLTKDAVIPTNAAGHTKLVIESLRSQINQLVSKRDLTKLC
jgi:E3 ubiquitin-protein ligase RNF220